jgi:ribonuclease HII
LDTNQSRNILVAGIDEVGRGSIAGPLVAGVVILPPNHSLELYDSKSINRNKRNYLNTKIINTALEYATGWVTNKEIDEYGLAWSLQEAYLRALTQIPIGINKIILDGNVNYLSDFGICETIIGADKTIDCVSAASIIAKVARDDYMMTQSVDFPAYSYETNVGYGTVSHLKAIKEYGLSRLHRKSFCKKYL